MRTDQYMEGGREGGREGGSEREREMWVNIMGNPANHVRYLRDICEHIGGLYYMDVHQPAWRDCGRGQK